MRESGIGRRQALAAGVAIAAAPGIGRAQAPRVRVMLDWAFQSPNAFAIVARERGFFRDAGVDATVERGQGSGAVPVALANGTADLGYADLSPAIRFAAQNPDRGIIAVAVLHDRSPLCAIVRADGPVRAPRDLEGRRLAAPDFDAGRQLFPAFARAAGIEPARVTFVSVTPALREPMLVRREVEGITGFVTTSALALKGIGLDHPQQRVMMYYEHGLDLYGGALLTTRAFAERNPQALRGAVAALMRGMRSLIAEPAAAMDMLKRAEPLVEVPLETERHQMNMRLLVLTDHVRANGLSAVNMGRMQAGIRAVEGSFNLPEALQAAQFYVPDFLPPRAELSV